MAGALIEKAPASFVFVEILLPGTVTVTSARGEPPALTLPVITCWAHKVAEVQNSRMHVDTILAVFTAESNELLIMTSARLVLVIIVSLTGAKYSAKGG